MTLQPIPEPQTQEERIDAWLANSNVIARCQETGAELTISRAQYTLVYGKAGGHGIYITRHWSRRKVAYPDVLQRAQKSLDKIIAEQQEVACQ